MTSVRKNILKACALVFSTLVLALALPSKSHAQCGAALPNDGSFDCAGYVDTCGGACVTPEYVNSISGSESGGNYNCPSQVTSALGRYQFINGTRNGLCAKYSCLPCVSREAFANCPALQDAYFQAFNRDNWATLQACGATSYIGQQRTIGGETVTITESCLLAMAHLRGAGYGNATSPGACGGVINGWDTPDALGTDMASYCQRHGGVQAFTTDGTCEIPPGTAVNPGDPGGGGAGSGDDTEIPGAIIGPTGNSYSGTCSDCNCSILHTRDTINHIIQNHEQTREHITLEFRYHQNWLFGSNEFFGGPRDSFFELHILPALMMMTEQLVTAGMQQMFILGTFFDAEQQLETHRLFQEKIAEAHRDYQPSFHMCVVGTTARGMAAADRNGELASFVMSQRSQDRQLGMWAANSARDASTEREGRIRQIKERYCDPRDNSDGLGELCEAGKNPALVNKDIDYSRTIDSVRTLNIDFTDPAQTADEIDTMSLANNLFSNTVFDKPTRTPADTEGAEGAYMQMRSLVAKRSVVENSFNSIVGLKTAGTEISEETILFTQKMLEQLGIDNEDHRLLLLGGTVDNNIDPALRPSYYAQLEVLAQRIYQSPEFFTNLYDKPANVLRKDVAMQAINLMLERDMHKSELRSEMVMSIWLEMELLSHQNDVQNRLNALEEKYQEN